MKKNVLTLKKSIFSILLVLLAIDVFAATEPNVSESLDDEGNKVITTTYQDDDGNDVEKIETEYIGGQKRTSTTTTKDVYKNVVSSSTYSYTIDDDENETTEKSSTDSDGKKTTFLEKKDKDGNIKSTETKEDEFGYTIKVEKSTDKNGKITTVTTRTDSSGNVVSTDTSYSTVEEEKRNAENEASGKKTEKKKKKKSTSNEEKSSGENKDNRTTINIENARNTRYEKDKATGNDVIVLSGDVKISVSKGSSKNVINADTVRYDRTSEMIYAAGGVSLEQTTENSGGQTVSASSLMFNTSTLEGVFDDGRVVQTKSDALNLPSGSSLIVASDIFGRSESNTIAFKDGELTFCADEDPHWRIKASRIWLLPGGEFSFLNARVYAGPVPILYLPAFYYPKDELIFNPVFGFEKKRGYFIQTTSYIYGRKPLDSGSSSSSSSSNSSDSAEKLKALFNFVKPSTLKEQKREGLVLHNLDSDYKGNTSNYFKVLGDYYTNLGIMTGFESVLKPKKYFSEINLSAKLGFSNTVFKEETRSSGEYLPYSPNGNRIYDHSNFLGFDLPFRYNANLKMSLTAPFRLNISMPIYSDPYFSDHFNKREETMDWISFLIAQSQTDDDETNNTSTNEVSSFSWTADSSYSVPLPKFIKPYINTLSFSLNSALVFSSMETALYERDSNGSIKYNEDGTKKYLLYTDQIKNVSENIGEIETWQRYTPQRKFYYPSQITPFTLNGTLSGTLLDLSTSKKSKKEASKIKYTVDMIRPDEFITESEKIKKAEEAEKLAAEKEAAEKEASVEKNNADSAVSKKNGKAEKEKAEEEEKEKITRSLLPLLNGVKGSVENIPGPTFTMKYSVRPTLTTQVAYNTNSSFLQKPDDFQWDELKSAMYNLKIPVTVDNNFSYGGKFFTFSNSYTYSPVWQEHPYIHTNEDAVKDEEGNVLKPAETVWYSESERLSLKKSDYAAHKQDLTNSNSVALRPFSFIPAIKETGITWRSNIKMIRTEFLSKEFDEKRKTEDDPDPEWDYHWIDWDDENCITTNAIDYTVATNQMDNKFSQSFTLTTTLKPLKESYYGTLKLTFPYTTYSIETGEKKVTESKTKYTFIDGKLEEKSEEEDVWQDQPLKQTLSISGKVLKQTMTASASYTFNRDDSYDDSLSLKFSWYGLTASYQMSYTKGYSFYSKNDVLNGVNRLKVDEDGKPVWNTKKDENDILVIDPEKPVTFDTISSPGWIQDYEKKFQPYSFSLSYAPSKKTIYAWKNRINLSVGVNTSVVADLLKPTSSYFTFAPSFSLKIHEFFTMTLTASVRNNVINRYFGNPYDLNGETNIFKDLANSFRFDDDSLREASGFKLKSLNLTMTHELHDWDLNATFKVEPRLITDTVYTGGKKVSQKSYDFNPYISISIVWRPMSAMKTEIVDKYGEWELK